MACGVHGEAHAEEQPWRKALIPSEINVTAGALFPSFLIYENPVPWVGAEAGWRTGPHTLIVANVGMSVIWTQGSQRFLHPVGVSFRAFPWKNVGPWIQIGLGAIPFIEQIRLALPQRLVTATDAGATLTTKVQAGVFIGRFELGLGVDLNVLPSPFYQNYKGIETLPWDDTFMVWIGWQAWVKKDKSKNTRKP